MTGNRVLGLMRIKNSAKYLRACLRSQFFCDKILVLNDYSEDESVSICREFSNVEVIPSPWPSDYDNYARGRDKQYLAEVARDHSPEWICSLDADEVWEEQVWQKIEPWLDSNVMLIQARVLHLWDDALRVDGHFGAGFRQRLWRFFPGARTYTSMHDSLPFEFRWDWAKTWPKLALWHYHYVDPENRRRCSELCQRIDPDVDNIPNRRKDYAADIQGDPGGPPKDLPLSGEPFRLQSVDSYLVENPEYSRPDKFFRGDSEDFNLHSRLSSGTDVGASPLLHPRSGA